MTSPGVPRSAGLFGSAAIGGSSDSVGVPVDHPAAEGHRRALVVGQDRSREAGPQEGRGAGVGDEVGVGDLAAEPGPGRARLLGQHELGPHDVDVRGVGGRHRPGQVRPPSRWRRTARSWWCPPRAGPGRSCTATSRRGRTHRRSSVSPMIAAPIRSAVTGRALVVQRRDRRQRDVAGVRHGVVVGDRVGVADGDRVARRAAGGVVLRGLDHGDLRVDDVDRDGLGVAGHRGGEDQGVAGGGDGLVGLVERERAGRAGVGPRLGRCRGRRRC